MKLLKQIIVNFLASAQTCLFNEAILFYLNEASYQRDIYACQVQYVLLVSIGCVRACMLNT